MIVLEVLGGAALVGLAAAASYDRRARRHGWRVGVPEDAGLDNRTDVPATGPGAGRSSRRGMTGRGGNDAEYVSFFTYSSETWGRMISAPGDRTAVVSIAAGSSGAFKHLETHELFTQDQLGETLARAKSTTQAYRPPGQQG